MKKNSMCCAIISATLLVLNVSSLSASAATDSNLGDFDVSSSASYSLIRSGNNQIGMYVSGGFSGNEWESKCDVYKSSNNSIIGEFVFGYDTDFINEDYTWTRGSYSCKAGVMRHNFDSDFSWSFAHDSWNWGKKEVTHLSDSVSYAIRFTDDNLNVYPGMFSGSLYKD